LEFFIFIALRNDNLMTKLGGGKVLILGIMLCLGFFVGQKCRAATAGDAVINEIAWMGSANGSDDEWIELKNSTAAPLDLSGWTIEYGQATSTSKLKLDSGAKTAIDPNGYFLLEKNNSGGYLSAGFDLKYKGGLLNNTKGAILILKDGSGNIIDSVDFSQGWKWNGSAAGDSGSGKTAERCSNDWQTSAAAGGTPKAANDCATVSQPVDNNEDAPADPESDPNSGSNSGSGSASIYNKEDVLINEFVSDPAAGENEWVELYYPGPASLSLNGWTIADGSGAETVLSGGFAAGDYYFTAEKFKGALNNDGDEIILYDGQHNIIDQVLYGKFGGNPADNAPAPGKGQSAALKIDGQKSSISGGGYVITDTPTKGAANQILASADDSGEATTSQEAPGEISITEIFPNPIGSDRDNEFIELYNNTDSGVDLSGWRIAVADGRSFQFGQFLNLTRTLAAQSYFPLYRRDSNLVLDNNGGTLRLYAPGKSRAAQTLSYGKAEEGLSYCDTDYLDLIDPDSATKIFLRNSLLADRWVWSRLPTPGKANQVKTPNHPPQASFSAPAKIKAGAAADFDASDSFDEDGDPLSFGWDFAGAEQFGVETASHIFTQPGNYTIRLTASDGEDESVIKKIIKVSGMALVRSDEVAVNSQPLPLPEKVTNQADSKISLVKATVAAAPAAKGKTVKAAAVAIAVSSQKSLAVSGGISSLNNYKLGASLKLTGHVLVLPGVFGSQYFYLLPATNTLAIKIYNYHKDFPTLKIGDRISVSGVIGGSATDKYLKTKTAADIKVIAASVLPAPEEINSAGLNEDNLNKFVAAKGEIEFRSSQEIKLAAGTGEIEVYFKNGAKIAAANFKAGQEITAVGLVGKTASGFAILPRGQSDLILAATSTAAADSVGEVLGTATGSSAWTLPARTNNPQLPIYMLIAAAGIIIILTGFLFKKYLKK
jgi:hypothetical protein